MHSSSESASAYGSKLKGGGQLLGYRFSQHLVQIQTISEAVIVQNNNVWAALRCDYCNEKLFSSSKAQISQGYGLVLITLLRLLI